MAEDLDFEGELDNLLARSGEDSGNATEMLVPSVLKPDRLQRKILSQAEIDALLARMNPE